MGKINGYLATFFFDKFGFEGTAELAKQVRQWCPNLNLYVPQENGDINDKSNNDNDITAETIYIGDRDKLMNTDILIACIDGVETDSGVSAEIGFLAGLIEGFKLCNIAHRPKKIILFYTDMRQDGTGDNHMYKNLFTKGAGEHFGITVRDVHSVISEVNAYKKYQYNTLTEG